MLSDDQIIPIILRAGSTGLTADKLARHIYNATNSFFAPVEFASVKRQVESFLRRNSRHSYSLLLRSDSHPASYRLNPASPQMAQLSLDFDGEEPSATPTAAEELELPLFLDFE